MKKLSAMLILIVIGYGQINWEIEFVDSTPGTGGVYYDFHWCSIALDTNEVPHIVYYKSNKVIHAVHYDTDWQKELVESGLFYTCFSLIFNKDNNAHLSYYRKDDALNMTYLCYARCDTTGWLIDVVDSIYGIITKDWFLSGYYGTSIALDTLNLPGIAYTSWNLPDSLHYIKYAHFNGVDWDTSLVEYDSAWSYTLPSDWPPSLKFNSNNIPIIAFHQVYDNPQDTIKLAYFDDSLNIWIIEPAICDPHGCASISLALDSCDYPCIAHGLNAALAYSWWDGFSWHTEYAGPMIGTSWAQINLGLDDLDNPHIAFYGDPLTPSPDYCYKKDNVWYIYMPFEDSVMACEGDISIDLDNNDEPHMAYFCESYFGRGIKYAKGTFVGIEETRTKIPESRYELEIYPNPFSKLTNISFDRVHPDRRTHSSYGTSSTERTELKIYDVSGRLIRDFLLPTTYSIVPTVISWDGRDYSGHRVPEGIYFIRLSCDSISITKKVIFLK